MTKKYNTQNLIPNSERTPSELREITSKGGKMSAEAKRMRKTMKEELLIMLESKDMQEKLCVAIIKKALKGDTKAFQVIRDTIGEKPAEKIDFMSTNINLQKAYDEVNEILEKQKQAMIKERAEILQIECQDQAGIPPPPLKICETWLKATDSTPRKIF